MTVQAELIKKEIKRVRNSTDRLLKKQLKEFSTVLNRAALQVKDQLNHFEEIAPLSQGQTFRLAQLNNLKTNIIATYC